ncbi:hypothetical protein [Streptococcus devriesei]|uniref:hypothetical protein n=1 Tax=Streptococcus devriesei TaxID=231233 RepID=UPI00041DBF47|nr:hypothetical protein [Streptococcus devriesei]
MILELKRWHRSKRLYLLVFVFVCLALTSTLSTYYANDIIKQLSSSANMIRLPEPTWQSVMESYFKNVVQMGIFISLYSILGMSNISKTESLRLFFQTRTSNLFKIFFPKLLASLISFIVASLAGFLSALYLTFALCDKINLGHSIYAYLLNLLGVVGIVIIGFLLHIIVNAPFAIAGVFEIILLISSAWTSVKILSEVLFTNWLLPTDILIAGFKKVTLSPSIWYLLGYIVLLICINMVVFWYRRRRHYGH